MERFIKPKRNEDHLTTIHFLKERSAQYDFLLKVYDHPPDVRLNYQYRQKALNALILILIAVPLSAVPVLQ